MNDIPSGIISVKDLYEYLSSVGKENYTIEVHCDCEYHSSIDIEVRDALKIITLYV